MRHCIASYAKRTVGGWAFLFHVEYGGESASVEVDPWEIVRQARGPRNCWNTAAEWGTKELARW